MTHSRRIRAFYPGLCRVCGRPIAKGTEIYFRKHYGIRCVECGPHTSQDERLPSKRAGRKKARSAPQPAPAPVPWEPFTGDGRFRPATEVPGFRAQDRAAILESDGVHRIEYGSVRELVEDALSDYAQTDGNLERLRGIQAMAFSGTASWGNYFTRERLLDQVFNPAPELMAEVDRMRERLMGELPLPIRPRRKLRRGLDCGDELDVDRWLVRDPNSWERMDRTTDAKRTVTVGCNISVHHLCGPEDLLYRGAAAVALADRLTQQGCNVGIVLFKVSLEPSTRVDRGVLRCQLKASDMPLDLPAIAFALCEIAFYRCVVVVAGARRWPGTLAKGLGAPVLLPEADRRSVDFLIDSDVRSESAAVSWLNRQLEGMTHV